MGIEGEKFNSLPKLPEDPEEKRKLLERAFDEDFGRDRPQPEAGKKFGRRRAKK